MHNNHSALGALPGRVKFEKPTLMLGLGNKFITESLRSKLQVWTFTRQGGSMLWVALWEM